MSGIPRRSEEGRQAALVGTNPGPDKEKQEEHPQRLGRAGCNDALMSPRTVLTVPPGEESGRDELGFRCLLHCILWSLDHFTFCTQHLSTHWTKTDEVSVAQIGRAHV